MMSLFESAWVIARRDFIATVYSRSFVFFLLIPLVVFGAALLTSQLTGESQRNEGQPVVAIVADSATVQALDTARNRLVQSIPERVIPRFRTVAPAENVGVQAQRLLADESLGYSAVLSGTIERPVLTGPARVDESVGERLQLVIDDARRTAALSNAGVTQSPTQIERVVTAQAAGNLQMIRRAIARGTQMIIFGVTVLLATLLLSNLAEEKTNKVIEILAAAVPLDAVFLGKIIAMLGTSFVGLALWGGMLSLGYFFVSAVQSYVNMPEVGPAVGWPAFVILVILYYGANYVLLGSLFLGIGAQASNIREIQTLSMPVTMLQVAVFLVAVSVVGSEGGALNWFAYLFPFSSPLAMVALASTSASLWPHLLALLWQAVWVVIIIRLSTRLFRRTVLKSQSAGSFFSLDFWKKPASE
jgi:ABC-2 type transport system permease protein